MTSVVTVPERDPTVRETGSAAPIPRVSPFVLAPLFGLLAGIGEVILATMRDTVWVHPEWPLSRDYFWMTPLAEVFVFILAAGILVLIGKAWKFAASTTAALGLMLFLCVFIWLAIPSWFGWYAEVLLAAGVAAQSPTILKRLGPRFGAALDATTGWVRRLVPGQPPRLGHAHGLALSVVVLVLVGLVGGATVLKRAADDRAAIAALPAPPPGTPNVLLIVWDTARAMNMSLYGYQRDTTPNLVGRASDAVVLDHVVSPASWTLPSHASMFTGRWHHELSANWFVPLNDEFPTLAEVLTQRGLSTAGFAANVSYVSFKHGLDRGFIHFEDYPVSAGQVALSSAIGRLFIGWNWLRGLIEHHRALNVRTADEMNEEVLDWLDTHGDRPFFVFANYFDAHEPLLPPEPFHSRFGPRRPWGPFEHGMNAGDHADKYNRPAEDVQMMVDRYDASIAYLDDALERLLERLEERGLLENTLVILTSDHGEHWGEKELFDHGNSLYQQLLHVPFVVFPPSGHERGLRVEAPASLRDIPATVLHYLDQPNGVFPGRSLTRLYHGQAVPDTLMARLDTESRHARAAVVGPYKYIRMTVAGSPRTYELFQYIEDPLEERNLYEEPEYQALAQEMDSTLVVGQRSSSTVLPVPSEEPPIAPAAVRP